MLDMFAAYNASRARIVEGRGFGFVDVDTNLAEKAVEEKDGAEAGGRRINVNPARPKTDRGPRDFGGGGGGGGRDFGGGGGGGGGGFGGGGGGGRGGFGGGRSGGGGGRSGGGGRGGRY